MYVKENDIKRLFEIYFELRKGTSGYEIDVSDIDYEAFIKALSRIFFDLSVI